MSVFPLYCTPVINRLTDLMVKGIEEDEAWLEKAIKSLAKKLRKSRQLEDFESVLHTRDPLSKCITIARSLDGRLQIAHRKVLPHVAYCRLFRWPDLHSYHELKSLGNCDFSFHRKRDQLCINPYHYYKAEILIMPPVYVPRHPKMVQRINDDEGRGDDKHIFTGPNGIQPKVLPEIHSKPPVTSQNLFRCDVPELYQLMKSLRNGASASHFEDKDVLMEPYSNNFQFECPIMAPVSMVYNQKFGAHIDQIINLIQKDSGVTTLNGTSLGLSLGIPSFTLAQSNSQNGLGNRVTNNAGCSSIELGDIVYNGENVGDSPTHTTTVDGMISSSVLPALKKHCLDAVESCSLKSSEYELINYQSPRYWCSVSYYESNRKIGSTYTSNSKVITIDFAKCYSSSRHNMFGFKSLTNSFRPKQTEAVLKLIGPAVRLVHCGGEVMMECLCKDVPVFVSSSNYNVKNNLRAENVQLLKHGDSMTVFDYHDFAPLLAKCISHGYESVYRLLSWTVIRVSFSKGWGEHFKRQTPHETPVWFEVQLTGPLGWLDKILRHLISPSTKCSSMT